MFDLIAYFDSFHSENRYAVSTGQKDQELLLIFKTKLVEDFPEFLDDRMIGRVLSLVFSILFELGKIVVFIANDHGH